MSILCASLNLFAPTASAEFDPATPILVALNKSPVKSGPETMARSPKLSLEGPSAASTRSTSAPLFVPRVREGSPARRVGGATRTKGQAVTIQALVPEVDEAALTLVAQPHFYWHISAGTTMAINFTLVDPDAIDPVVDAILPGPFTAGVHVVSLGDYEAQLDPEKYYEWYVAVVSDPKHRSGDSVARGAIERVTDSALESNVERANIGAVAALLAKSGIWYDSLDHVSRQIEAKPEDAKLRAWRTSMLKQVGIDFSEDR